MTRNLSEKDWSLVEQWLDDASFINWAKSINDQDVNFWENYFNNHPQHWELAKVGKSLVLGIPFKDIAINKADGEKALSSLLQRLKENSDQASKITENRIFRVQRSWQVAASIAILAVISGFIYFEFFYNPEVIVSTDFGQQTEIILTDGSVVTLNANSVLRYHKQNSRKVRLKGEAYFEVAKKPDTGEKFQVITQDLLVTVLGTSFNVNTRNDQTEVMVQEGKVVVDVTGPDSDIIEMNPGDLISYSKKNNELKENQDDISRIETAAWKEGSLIFKDTPITDALFEIEDIYGIQFILQTNALETEAITGGVPIKDLSITLSTLSEVYGIQMKVVGKRYFISGKTK